MSESPPPTLPLRIALIEDDPLMRMGLKQFLESDPLLEVVGSPDW